MIKVDLKKRTCCLDGTPDVLVNELCVAIGGLLESSAKIKGRYKVVAKVERECDVDIIGKLHDSIPCNSSCKRCNDEDDEEEEADNDDDDEDCDIEEVIDDLIGILKFAPPEIKEKITKSLKKKEDN